MNTFYRYIVFLLVLSSGCTVPIPIGNYPSRLDVPLLESKGDVYVSTGFNFSQNIKGAMDVRLSGSPVQGLGLLEGWSVYRNGTGVSGGIGTYGKIGSSLRKKVIIAIAR